MICLIKSDQGITPSKVCRGGRTHRIDFPTHKIELMRGLMGDGPIVDGCDYPFSEEGCQVLPTQVSFGLLALGVSPKGHDVFCHGTLLELVFDRLLRVWTG
jgi:hypothetical protein